MPHVIVVLKTPCHLPWNPILASAACAHSCTDIPLHVETHSNEVDADEQSVVGFRIACTPYKSGAKSRS